MSENMLMINPTNGRNHDRFSSTRARDLDLNRVSLVPLEQIEDGKFSFLRPMHTEAYNTDPQLRKAALKARSVLAAAFIRGDLDARYVEFDGEDVLLIGQSSTMLSAFGDFTSLVSNDLVHNPDVKGVVPITELDSGWRTQFGWMAMFSPEVDDHLSFYQYIRPSIVWFESKRTLSHAESLEILADQRGMLDNPQRPLEDIFREALGK